MYKASVSSIPILSFNVSYFFIAFNYLEIPNNEIVTQLSLEDKKITSQTDFWNGVWWKF